jgi:hypothetical protein
VATGPKGPGVICPLEAAPGFRHRGIDLPERYLEAVEEEAQKGGVPRSPSGRRKIASLLLESFANDPLARSWFSKEGGASVYASGSTTAPTRISASPASDISSIMTLTVLKVSIGVIPVMRPMTQKPLSFAQEIGLEPQPMARAR